MLRAAVARAARAGWRVGNIDVTVIAEKPRIGPHREMMRQSLATALDCLGESISIKGKTNEGMGWIGREEGLACIAVAMLVSHPAR
jgi:2-C-methyl-D-erythritol 2,4-cyclodiphosphate synthase